MKLRTGYVAKWKDEQGYGFIRSRKGKGREVFLHINALQERYRRPRVGDIVHYQLAVDKEGRAYARYASLSRVKLKHITQADGANPNHPSPSKPDVSKPVVRSTPMALEVFLLSLLPVLGSVHWVITIGNPVPLILYPLMSWLTYALYAEDKFRAKQKPRRRITEKTLHLCELTGGWIGAFIAQRRLRHKSSKVAYQTTFRAIILVHQIFWLGWFLLQFVTQFR